MSLGTYPATSLTKAHTRVDEACAAIEDGTDPRELFAKPDALQSICEEWAEREAGGLRTGADRCAALKRSVDPVLGDRPVKTSAAAR